MREEKMLGKGRIVREETFKMRRPYIDLIQSPTNQEVKDILLSLEFVMFCRVVVSRLQIHPRRRRRRLLFSSWLEEKARAAEREREIFSFHTSISDSCL